MSKLSYPILFLLITLFSCNNIDEKLSLVNYVDPFIGTGGHGHTYPGATAPFGMVQLSPDTRLEGWDGCSGYHYTDSVIYGFSHTHLSGTGIPDYCDILFMPTTGPVQLNNGADGNIDKGYGSRFSHKNETAFPGYYSVDLDDYQIKVDLTATPRTGIHKYKFPDEEGNIIIDLEHRDKVIESGFKIVGNREVEGFRRSTAWANDQVVFFVARFSKPFNAYGIAIHDSILAIDSAYNQSIKAFLKFDTSDEKELMVKVGISAVDIEGARKNLEKEAPHWDFDKYRNKAEQQWNSQLNKIVVEGDEIDKTVFYTALYHASLNPNLYMDVDGRYRGTDKKIHTAEGFTNYTIFSLWDTYRAEHPLFTIIEQERTLDFINTMLHMYKNGGQLPVWELASNYTGCMIGYHSIPVIVDAWIKGIDDFDTELAFEAMKHSADQDHLGLGYYKKLGYIPSNKEGESVSKTLEYAYDDWCIAQAAKLLGNENDYNDYIKRAQYYKNIYDPTTGFMRARIDGLWQSPFDPKEVNFNYTEANSWQYSFYVPQDISGLIDLMGGEDVFEAKLDQLFSEDEATTGRHQSDITGLIGQYAHGNEPSHHMAYLYNYIGKPWKNQERVREILTELYHEKPDGLCGNEDCGQMSAWYVMSAMGFYPVCPGQDFYVVGSPLFERVTINLENGKKFEIVANGNSTTNKYIQEVYLNGREHSSGFLSHEDITRGGMIKFVMGTGPNKDWAKNKEHLPYSSIDNDKIIPVPYIVASGQTFHNTATIELGCSHKNINIYYTLDGTIPNESSTRYESPVILSNTVKLYAIAIDNNGKSSKTLEANFYKIPGNISIELKSSYNNQYTGGGDFALIDQLRGGDDFKTGRWQGYHGVDMEAVVNLGSKKSIEEIIVGCLQDNNSWIFMPEKIDLYYSTNGKKFNKITTLNNDISPQETGSITKDYKASNLSLKAQYIKVIAHNMGLCPEWHKGAGGKAWIFLDEILIR